MDRQWIYAMAKQSSSNGIDIYTACSIDIYTVCSEFSYEYEPTMLQIWTEKQTA